MCVCVHTGHQACRTTPVTCSLLPASARDIWHCAAVSASGQQDDATAAVLTELKTNIAQMSICETPEWSHAFENIPWTSVGDWGGVKMSKFSFLRLTFSSLIHSDEPEGPLYASWSAADVWLSGDRRPKNLSGLRPPPSSGSAPAQAVLGFSGPGSLSVWLTDHSVSVDKRRQTCHWEMYLHIYPR